MILTCKGFLFDLDGTLVDSLSSVEYCWKKFSHRLGISEKDVLEYIHGKPAITSIRHFMPHTDETDIKNIFHWLENMETENMSGIVAMPGAISLLEKLNKLFIPWAIVTSATMSIALNRIKSAGLPEPLHWVTVEKVKNGKPHPDPFLLGAKLLGLPPKFCIAIEDAEAGIYSALDAGCPVIALNAQLYMPRRSEISMIIKSLTELNIAKIDHRCVIRINNL
ncbi:sugar phosphatase [Arsenophonus symbiont of Ornithomya chloropus]|uniref:sugar phosphatase n=1 Tax=Arsenophonus symbiont of Ornithomya chloropus TaxID=634121 RepID=UPI0032B256E8